MYADKPNPCDIVKKAAPKEPSKLINPAHKIKFLEALYAYSFCFEFIFNLILIIQLII